ncbi:MAG: type I phosphomannose isomerase catalytic subunit [Clostridia bacterium]
MELIFLESLYKEKLWGSETWLISAHKNGETKIQSGEYKGKFLSEVYNNFPLLVKIIDAKDDLSIQVHPNDEYAKKYENSKGKTECWYVLDCKEDASLIIGHNAKDKTELTSMIQKGEWNSLLREVKIKKGDFFQIEPGTIHAIKGGVKILEIQESSDITYRLYDYDRLENGKPRELHTKESIENITCPFEEKVCRKFSGELVSCMYYTVEKINVAGNKILKSKNQPVIVSCIEGEGYADDEKIQFGTSFIIPPFHETTMQGDMEIILSYEKRENVKIGIDLGGTNIAVGLVDRFGRLIDKISSPTKSERGIDAIVSDIVLLCNTIAEKNNLSMKDIVSVGIGCPGTIDAEGGVVVYSNNIRMDNVPLRDMLEEKLKVKVNIENDANAAAFGEYITNFKDAKSFVLMTLGTGVGSGLVIDGKLYRGFNGAGFECGHMIIHPNGEKCTCGNLGCLEAYASASALKKRGEDSCENIFALAHNGNDKYQRVLDDYITDLSIGVGNVINIIQPEVLAIGGGVSNAGDELLNPLKEKVKDMDFNKHLSKTEIVTAKLKNDAGIIGAALI